MKRTFLVLGLGIGLMQCQNSPPSGTPAGRDTGATDVTAATTGPRCYAYTSAQDTIRLMLRGTGEDVRGTLVYKWKEKDHNTGTLSGRMRGDTLRADYVFQSEGMTSVREVAFLVRDGRVREGYGPLQSRDGKVSFSQPNRLDFHSGFVLTSTTCPE